MTSVAEIEGRADRAREHVERVARELPGLQYALTDTTATRFEHCYGLADAGAHRPVDGGTLFMTASCTKVVTAAGIERLVETGRVELERSLSDYFAEHPYGREVTVGQLLAHTSGVPNPMPLAWLHRLDDAQYDEDRALAAVLRAHPRLIHRPGSRYAYSNLGYWLLGKVIERASGSTYTRYIHDEVLASSAFPRGELGFAIAEPDLLARGYLRAWSPLGLFARIAVRGSFREGRDGPWLRFARVQMNGLAYGGLFATARAFCSFLRGRIAKPPTVALGWRNGQLAGVAYFGKPGGGPGFCGNVRVYPSAGIATAWFANHMEVSEREIDKLADAIDSAWLA